MNKEIDESPYCDVCGTCGYIGCCGIRNFINQHIKGKTNCKNEDLIISELIDLVEYEEERYKKTKQYKEVLDKIKEYIENLLKEEFEVTDPDSTMFGEKCQRAYFSDSELVKILELLEEIE